jgi:hypothetical protein
MTRGIKKTADEKAEENSSFDLDNIFDTFIKEGSITKEKEIVPGFRIKLKVLSVGELLSAEAAINADMMPMDVVVRARSARILSVALVSINGVDIERPSDTKEVVLERRNACYRKLLDMAPIVIQKAYEYYIELVKEQTAYYEKDKKLVEETENF